MEKSVVSAAPGALDLVSGETFEDMDQQKQDIFTLQKDMVLLGTYETSAFVLSLRDPKEFSTVHSFGFHRIPHIGVYGSDYAVTHPMVLLSLPPVPSCLQNLPGDVLNALDLQHILAQQSAEEVPTPPATKLQSFSEHIRAALHNRSDPLDSDICSRMIARELVKLVLLSACNKLGLNGHNHLHPTTFMELSRKTTSTTATSTENGADVFTFSKYRESKRISTVSIMSTDSEFSRKESVVSLQNGNGGTEQSTAMNPKRRPRRQPIIATDRPIEVNMQMEDEEELRLMAKKLVNKVLHAACKTWESLYRRSSIEYLIASTKRMRIASSPSPPPPLVEEKSNTTIPSFVIESQNKSAPGDSPVHGKGTKRARSGSHEVYMLNELEKFRQTQLHQKLREATENASSRPRRILKGARASSKPSLLQPPSSSENQHICPDSNSLTALISNIGRMSIAEADPEAEADSEEGSDEEYTILSAVTKTALDADDSSNFNKDGISRPMSSPTTQTDSTIDSTTNRMQNGYLGMEVSGSVNDILLTSNSQTKPTGFNKTCNVVPEMDCYVVIHTHPPSSLCQKFLCSNKDEINVLYHCWLFPDIAFDHSITRSQMLDMGVFEPSGVNPVHQDLQDAGIPFYYLDQRTVCIHGCHFSPENAQMQLQSGYQLHTFFSAAKHRNRRVCTYHIIPASAEIEQTVRGCISKCTTMGELLTELYCWFPEVGQKLNDLILPLNNHYNH